MRPPAASAGVQPPRVQLAGVRPRRRRRTIGRVRPRAGRPGARRRPVPPAQPYRHRGAADASSSVAADRRPAEFRLAGRSLIVLAVVLALLVLLCAGVISFLYNRAAERPMARIRGRRTGVVDGGSSSASYRLMTG